VDLQWGPFAGPGGSEDHLGADLTGHFDAAAQRLPDGRWSFVIRDYQGNEMLSGQAESREGAQAAVSGWDRWVVTSGTDPERDWPDGG
jgi:hypothetical protein